MKLSECSTDGCGPGVSGRPGRQQALCAARKARRAAEYLEQAFQLLVEEDPIQPTTEYVYAALFEAEVRTAVLEDRYERAYSGGGLLAQPRGSALRVSRPVK